MCKATWPEAEYGAALFYYCDSIMHARLNVMEGIWTNEMFDPRQPLTAGMFRKLDFALILKLPPHFSAALNCPRIDFSTLFLIDTASTKT